ncbi:MAG: hypothetical protein K2X29_14835 [Candidatus Obscuribacterales bacterium]|nr:hypothetical protein [Candidatus Obscuribacterales bacterium]
MGLVLKLRDIRLLISRYRLALSDGMAQIAHLLEAENAIEHKERIDWLRRELQGYDEANFPPAYVPPAKRVLGGWYKPGEHVPKLITHYRAQAMFLKRRVFLGQQERQSKADNLMPVPEIELWLQRLDDGHTANLGTENGWEKTSPRICFVETWHKISSRVSDLIDDVAEKPSQDGFGTPTVQAPIC